MLAWNLRHKIKPEITWQLHFAITKLYHAKDRKHSYVSYVIMMMVERRDDREPDEVRYQAYWGKVNRRNWLEADADRKLIACLNVIKAGCVLQQELAKMAFDFKASHYLDEPLAWWHKELELMEVIDERQTRESGDVSGSADPEQGGTGEVVS